MGCCGGNRGLASYTITYPDGKTTTVTTLTQAISVARRVGGTYKKNQR